MHAGEVEGRSTNLHLHLVLHVVELVRQLLVAVVPLRRDLVVHAIALAVHLWASGHEEGAAGRVGVRACTLQLWRSLRGGIRLLHALPLPTVSRVAYLLNLAHRIGQLLLPLVLHHFLRHLGSQLS